VSTLTPVERDKRRRRRRREDLIRWGIRALVVLLVFALGIAVGQALHDNPVPNQVTTMDRTIRLPTGGAPGSTITP
jgi:hypothetical protein